MRELLTPENKIDAQAGLQNVGEKYKWDHLSNSGYIYMKSVGGQ